MNIRLLTIIPKCLIITLCFSACHRTEPDYPPDSSIVSIREITHSTAIVRTEILFDNPPFVTGIVYGFHPEPTNDDSIIEVDYNNSPLRIPLVGLTSDTGYFIRSFTRNYEGIVTYSSEQMFKTMNVDIFVDLRDGNVYPEVKIGGQVWMGENMRYNIPGKSKAVKEINESVEDEKLGFLYPAEVCQDVCPSGWHLPTDEDWKDLEFKVGVPNSQLDSVGYRGADAGFAVREPGEEHWYFDNDLITNASGFTALPAGLYGESGYSGYGRRTFFWTAPDDSGTYYNRAIDDQCFEDNRGIQRNSKDFPLDDLTTYYSVRCVKNN